MATLLIVRLGVTLVSPSPQNATFDFMGRFLAIAF
jgi:hypothetical protein